MRPSKKKISRARAAPWLLTSSCMRSARYGMAGGGRATGMVAGGGRALCHAVVTGPVCWVPAARRHVGLMAQHSTAQHSCACSVQKYVHCSALGLARVLCLQRSMLLNQMLSMVKQVERPIVWLIRLYTKNSVSLVVVRL